MAMLAETRQRKRYNLVPRGKALYEDDSRFGTKMLEKMGWSKGKGLGANEDGTQDFVRVRYKNDIEGLGFEQRDDQWTQHETSFNGLLQTLNGEEPKKESEEVAEFEDDTPRVGFGFQNDEMKQEAKINKKSKLKEKISGISLEQRSKQSRARVHYKKFTKGKDLSQYSETDLANIFGKKAVDDQETAVNDLYQQLNQNIKKDEVKSNEEEGNGEPEKFGGVQTISTGLSVADYFKMKMAALKSRSEQSKPDSDNQPHDEADVEKDHNQVSKRRNKKRSHENLQDFADDDLNEYQVQSENVEAEVVTTEKKKEKKKKKNKELDSEEKKQISPEECIPDESNLGKATNKNQVQSDNVVESEAEVVAIEKKKKKKKNKELDPEANKQMSPEECIPDKANLGKAKNKNQVQSDYVVEYETEVVTMEKKKEKKKKKNKEIDPDDMNKKSSEQFISDKADLEEATKNKKNSRKRKLEIGISNRDGDVQHSENKTQTPKSDNILENHAIKSTKCHKKKENMEHTSTEKPTKEKELKDNTESPLRCQEEKVIRTSKTNRNEESLPKQLVDIERIKNLSLQELKDSISVFNVFQISSFSAEKFRNINLNFFPSSNLSQIEGYGISQDIELSVHISQHDEQRITQLWENNLNKYHDVSLPRKSYAKYVRELRQACKTKTKRPKLKVKMWKNKNVFSII